MYLIIDQGTSSTKAFLLDSNGQITYNRRITHKLYSSSRNHIECDASEIFNACKTLISQSVKVSKNRSILSMGLSVQRSTFLFWDRATIKPVTMALSWQDSRSKDVVENLKQHSEWIYNTTGLPLSPHFGGPKYQNMINESTTLKEKVTKGEVIFGTLSSYITHALTKEAAIDHSIASRTLLLDINTSNWSDRCLDLFKIPKISLPAIKPTKYNYGKVLDYDFSLNCVIGDQQAALIGQNGFSEMSIGMNFGTSASVLYNSGSTPKLINGLSSSVLFSEKKRKIYVSEGSINACNSLFYYLENVLNIDHEKMRWNERCKNQDTKGIFISGFSGIAAPYWISGFDDIYYNINKNNRNEVIRSAMESIGFLVNDIIGMIKINTLANFTQITASGGAARGSLLQFIADLSGQFIRRPKMKDKTALGVYKILNNDFENKMTNEGDLFEPKKDLDISIKIKQWNDIISSLRR